MKKIFITIFILLALPLPAMSDYVPEIIPQAGTLNNQNLDSLRQQQMERQIRDDYKRFEERKESGEAKKDEIEKKSAPVIRAKLEDYATEGVYIEKVEVSPSYILTKQEIEDILKDYNNQNLKIEQLKEIVDRINKLYLSYGFVTARAFLPE
jgi:hemolysin activation/secretion protein